MAFQNEYVSAEDVRNYKLADAFSLYHQFGISSDFQYKWTIDRESQSYLLLVKQIAEVGASGREEPTNAYIFLLYLNERKYEFLLSVADTSSKKFSESPFRVIWKLEEDNNQFNSAEQYQAVMVVFKKALQVYGYAGARKQIDNTEVECRF